jgi:predicted component of type VI protein secretion system
MNDSTNKKIKNIMNNMDPKALEKGLKTISEILETKQGKKIANSLKNVDKNKLIEKIAGDGTDISKKLDHINPESLSKKIHSIDKDKIISEITRDPALAKKLSEFLKDNN